MSSSQTSPQCPAFAGYAHVRLELLTIQPGEDVEHHTPGAGGDEVGDGEEDGGGRFRH